MNNKKQKISTKKISEMLGDRILSFKDYFDKNGVLKTRSYTCICPTNGCSNTVKVETKSHINQTCASCSMKQAHKNNFKTKHWTSTTLQYEDIVKAAPKDASADLFIEYQTCGNEFRFKILCHMCNSNYRYRAQGVPWLLGTCRDCVNTSQKKRPYERTYNQLIKRCKQNNRDITLTYEEFVDLCSILNCHYCGTTLNRAAYKSEKGSNSILLDRKDSNLGYTKDNCVPSCWNCNDTKGAKLSYDEMMLVMNFRKNRSKK